MEIDSAWGRRAAGEAAARGDIVVIVDTLSFSTAVVTAVATGARVHPVDDKAAAREIAAALGAEAAVNRNEVPHAGRYSLSPLSFLEMPAGACVVLPSPNGGGCCGAAEEATVVIAAAIVNATATGRRVADLAAELQRNVTVVACGERWECEDEDGRIRFAIEDWLGAGAIIAAAGLERTVEADVAANAFLSMRNTLATTLLASLSGKELFERGYEGDVTHAARLDRYGVVPILAGGWFGG